MDKNKLRVAVIGCGNIGAEEENYSREVRPGTHAAAFAVNKDVSLVAFVDVNEKKLRAAGRRFSGVKLYTDAETMFREMAPDIVSIATPTKYHAEQVSLAAGFGVPVILCEKPIAYFERDAKMMLDACRRGGSQLFVNHQRHFDGILRKWSKKVEDGILGPVFQANAYYYNGLMNNGTHLVDLIRIFLGDPVSLWGKYNNQTSSKEGDPNIDGVLFFKSGAMVTVQSLRKNFDYFGLDIFGDKGRLTIGDLGFTVKYQKKIPSRKYRGYFELSPKMIIEGKPRSMMKESINYVVDFARGKKPARGTGGDAFAVLKILLAFKESADNDGQEIIL